MVASFDFTAGLLKGCEALALAEPDTEALERLAVYFRELKHWSRRINLVAKKATDSEILEKHFLDSLTLSSMLQGEMVHLLDIGTGAGFPGLVCKAAMPEIALTLVEPRQKRVAFLSHICRSLQLENVTILDCRIEDETRIPSESHFSHITSRAVSELKLFLEMSCRFMKPGVQVICMKGPKWQEELNVYEKGAAAELFRVADKKEFLLPESGVERHLLRFQSSSQAAGTESV